MHTVSTVISPQVVLGPYGIAPWKGNSKFPDPTASWVYSVAGANIGAPRDTYTNFQTIYTNSEAYPVTASLFVMVDDTATVYLNGVSLGAVVQFSYDNVGPAMMVDLQPGDNKIDFLTYNAGDADSPAGLIYSLIDPKTNTVLIHSGPKHVGESVRKPGTESGHHAATHTL